MNENAHVVSVPDEATALQLGQLGVDGSSMIFIYDAAFFACGNSLNPFWKTTSGPMIRAEGVRRLHGIFGDSLPDAWGRAVLRRRLAVDGIDYETLSPIAQLQLLGDRAPGALRYQPSSNDDISFDVDIDHVAADASALLAGSEIADIEQLAALGGSSGGARPKVLVEMLPSGGMQAFHEATSDGAAAWIVKLPSRYDVVDIGPLEAAYADMARDAGLIVMPTKCIPSATAPFGYFATQRFDRGARKTRRHFNSVAGLLNLQWSEPSLDYRDILKIVRFVTKSQRDVEAMLRRMIFNIAAHNRDDHTKQHAFFHDFHGNWSMTPSYDLTYAAGPGGEHYLSVNGRGKDATCSDVITLAREQRISIKRTEEVIDEVLSAVSRVDAYMMEYGVSKSTRLLVNSAVSACIVAFR